MHICTVATLCFPEKTVPRNYYYCVQDENSLCLCFKNMYRTLFVAIFTSTFIFSMYDHFLVCLDAFSHTYRNINISNLKQRLQMHCSLIAVSKLKNQMFFLFPQAERLILGEIFQWTVYFASNSILTKTRKVCLLGSKRI